MLDLERTAPDETEPFGPSVVALGGGHGLSLALRAARHYAGSITAVVSVADDGGSSGRLRRDLDVPAPGDLRKCLVALAGDETRGRGCSSTVSRRASSRATRSATC